MKNNRSQPECITVSLNELIDLGRRALERNSTPPEVARQVVQELIKNEASGYSSHGLLRLTEYIQLISQGHIIPSSQPIKHSKNEFVTAIDGQKCFGVLSSQAASEALTTHLKQHQFGLVTLINSGHLGRLLSVALPVCQQGGVVMGFSNLAGAGQNVLPYGGNAGRLCTNPVVFGVPSIPPVIVDMSTSAISEGKLRKIWLQRGNVPKDCLFDEHWRPVDDPEKFYQAPKTAFLGPLGGKTFGYKGFALALMTEIFAGILTGGGFSQPCANKISNNGLFLTFHPELLGQSLAELRQQVNALIMYLRSSSLQGELHVPGWAINSQPKSLAEKQALSIELQLFKVLKHLATSSFKDD